MPGFGDLVSTIGGAVGDLFTSQGNAAEAASYTGAAQLERQNAQLTATSTRIQQTQLARQVSQSIGATQADVAGAGFTESGSALDILRSSAEQGSLAKSLVNIQGAINENSYAALAGADLAKAKAANEANTAHTIQSIASVGGALVDNLGNLASAGKTVVQGAEAIFGGASSAAATGTSFLAADGTINAGTGVADAFSAGLSGATQTTGVAADFASGLSGGADLTSLSAVDSSISSVAAIDTSAPSILGAGADAVTAGIGDFISGTVATVGAGIADAAASAAAIAAGVGDAVVSAGSFIADAALTALACA